jgi:hypothetical protein
VAGSAVETAEINLRIDCNNRLKQAKKGATARKTTAPESSSHLKPFAAQAA